MSTMQRLPRASSKRSVYLRDVFKRMSVFHIYPKQNRFAFEETSTQNYAESAKYAIPVRHHEILSDELHDPMQAFGNVIESFHDVRERKAGAELEFVKACVRTKLEIEDLLQRSCREWGYSLPCSTLEEAEHFLRTEGLQLEEDGFQIGCF